MSLAVQDTFDNPEAGQGTIGDQANLKEKLQLNWILSSIKQLAYWNNSFKQVTTDGTNEKRKSTDNF